MKPLPILLGAVAMLALSACGSRDEPKSEKSVSIEIGDKAAGTSGSSASYGTDGAATTAAAENDRFEISLPGGVGASVKLPAAMLSGTHFDIDGVGLYPGAGVNSFNVDAHDRKDGKPSVVTIGFQAPGDPAAVADWYQQQFEKSSRPVSRDGETLNGTTRDGDAFSVAMTPGDGGAIGTIRIIDAK